MFASRLSHQIPTCVAWKPDPHSHATDAFQQNTQQNTEGTSSQAHINNPSLDNTSLVSRDFEHVSQKSYFAALEKGPSEKSQRENSSPSSKQDSKTGGLDGFRAILQEE